MFFVYFQDCLSWFIFKTILQDLWLIQLCDIGFIVVLDVCVDFSYGCMPNKLLGTFSTVLIIDHAAAVGYNDTAVLITMTPISVYRRRGYNRDSSYPAY